MTATDHPSKSPDADRDLAAKLIQILADDEQWLMERILHFASRQGYTPYTSTLICAWQLSIAGLSGAIIAGLKSTHGALVEFRPHDDYRDNPIAVFARTEAIEHRKRGIDLGMFLGLLKYYRETYLDLVNYRLTDLAERSQGRTSIHRYFDLFEIAMCVEWHSSDFDTIIKELREANRKITNEKNFYLTAFESGADPAFLIDQYGCVIGLNESASTLLPHHQHFTGDDYYKARSATSKSMGGGQEALYDDEEERYIGQPLARIVPEVANLLNDLDADQSRELDFNLNLAGGLRNFHSSLTPMLDVSGKFSGSVVQFRDVTDQKIVENELREIAEIDPLTGAHNRRKLESHAAAELSRAHRNQQPLSVLALDLDHFKALNDTYGHDMGDRALVKFAEVCKTNIRPYDFFARTGGEEFIVLLPDTKITDAKELGERIRSHVASQCRFIGSEQVSLTVSIGVATLDHAEDTIGALLKSADRALYAAKASGRNQVFQLGQDVVTEKPTFLNQVPDTTKIPASSQKRSEAFGDVMELARIAGTTDDTDLFQTLVNHIAKTTGSDYLFIATLNENHSEAQTLAVCAHGEVADNFAYSLDGTPCSAVALDSPCVYPTDIQTLFPSDEMLVDMGIEGYVGIPLHDSKSRVHGIIVGLHHSPIENQDLILALFEIARTLIAIKLERELTEKSLADIRNFDQLTGLNSKSSLIERLAEPGEKSLLLIAFENISAINNAYGRDVGDGILSASAMEVCRLTEGDFTASLGPSKIAVVYEEQTDLRALTSIVHHHFLEHPITTNDVEVYVSIAFGWATGSDDLLRLATLTLEKSRRGEPSSDKDSGRTKGMDFEHHQKLIKVSNLVHDAIRRHTIFPRFQPIVDIRDGSVHKVEALARILYEGDILNPVVFLEAAYVSGIMPSLTREMIRESCKIMAGNTIGFSLNISESDFASGGLIDLLTEQAEHYGIAHERITLEILEGVSSSGKTAFLQQLRKLKEAGFKLSIDDFGTEYSSFSRILDLDIDYIKLDGSYVKRVNSDKRCRDIINAIIYFCKNSGIATIAEYVESTEIRNTLQSLGVDYAQGYLFSKPSPIEETNMLIANYQKSVNPSQEGIRQ